MFVAACFWGAGFLIGALGIATSQLWLLYLGYGVVGGIGLGIGYISPVSTLIKWFPDRPGLATGMAIMGFGGGALVASPLSRAAALGLRPRLRPQLGHLDRQRPRRSTMLFVTLGIVYFAVMMFGVAQRAGARRPAGRRPGFDPSSVKAKPMVTTASVSAANAIRTPQFWLLWVVLFCNVTAGIGILEQASPMIQDFFRGNGTSTVAGRRGRRVRRRPLAVQHGRPVRVVLHLGRHRPQADLHALPRRRHRPVLPAGHRRHTATALFVLLAASIISFYGGGFATAPAYLRDLFGVFQVGAIHGRLLTAWSAAGVAGPLIVNGFLDAQGKPGTLTAAAYRPALFTMVGVLAVGFVANLLIRPVAERFHEEHAKAAEGPADGEVLGAEAPSAATAAAASGQQGRLVLSWALVVLLLGVRRRADPDHGGQALRLSPARAGVRRHGPTSRTRTARPRRSACCSTVRRGSGRS